MKIGFIGQGERWGGTHLARGCKQSFLAALIRKYKRVLYFAHSFASRYFDEGEISYNLNSLCKRGLESNYIAI